MSVVEEKLKTIVGEYLFVDRNDLKGSSELSDIGADSLDLLEITMIVEEEFGIELMDDDLKRVVTFADFVNLVETTVN